MITMLLGFMFNDSELSPCDLISLHRLLSKLSVKNLWHGLFTTELTCKLHPNLLYSTQITTKIIRLNLSTLHLLWVKRCEIIHCIVDSETSVNELVELRSEVNAMLQDED